MTLEYFQVKLPPASPARIMLRFDSGDPAILERTVGLGRSILVTTSADVTWSPSPVHPTFPPIIHEIVRFAAGGRSLERQRLVGEPLLRPLSSRETALPIVVRTPDGTEHPLRPIQNERTAQVVYPETTHRGMYEILLGPTAAAKSPLPARRVPTRAAVNFLPSTSTRARATSNRSTKRRSARRRWPASRTSAVASGRKAPATRLMERADRSGLASWLLVAIVALLLVEPLLAWSFRHGFVLLCTLAACGVVAPWLPRQARSAAWSSPCSQPAAQVAMVSWAGNARSVGPAAACQLAALPWGMLPACPCFSFKNTNTRSTVGERRRSPFLNPLSNTF